MKQKPDQNKINTAQHHLQDVQNYKISASIIRSKEKLILEQEKQNKFFFDREKQKQKAKQLQKIQDNKTTTITNDFPILKHWKFFSSQYTKTQTYSRIRETLSETIKPKVNDKENETLIKQITLTELKTAIFQIENGKSPGIDGFPIEFYESQYEIIKNSLLQLYNSILFQKENLTPSINQAIITLIPTNDKKELVKNWRPKSFLCVDYKILTKILSKQA